MKTIKDVMELATELMMTNSTSNSVMVNYSGHVNKLTVDVFEGGYDFCTKNDYVSNTIFSGYLNTEAQIQNAYWSLASYMGK